jgi:hypothetical protein
MICVILVLVTAFTLNAYASVIYEIDAASKNLEVWSDFSLTFADLDNDALFSLNELLTFSGVEIRGTETYLLDQILHFMSIDGISDQGDVNMYFYNAQGHYAATGLYWDFTKTEQTIPTPEPATVLLIGIGLTGVVGFRRKFSK